MVGKERMGLRAVWVPLILVRVPCTFLRGRGNGDCVLPVRIGHRVVHLQLSVGSGDMCKRGSDVALFDGGQKGKWVRLDLLSQTSQQGPQPQQVPQPQQGPQPAVCFVSVGWLWDARIPRHATEHSLRGFLIGGRHQHHGGCVLGFLLCFVLPAVQDDAGDDTHRHVNQHCNYQTHTRSGMLVALACRGGLAIPFSENRRL